MTLGHFICTVGIIVVRVHQFSLELALKINSKQLTKVRKFDDFISNEYWSIHEPVFYTQKVPPLFWKDFFSEIDFQSHLD
jgi:hypothetical protein